jgi:hypothetical protein
LDPKAESSGFWGTPGERPGAAGVTCVGVTGVTGATAAEAAAILGGAGGGSLATAIRRRRDAPGEDYPPHQPQEFASGSNRSVEL